MVTVRGVRTSALAATAALHDLRGIGLAVAPHVAMRLCAALSDDQRAVTEVAAVLTPGQLAGRSALPDPLPSVSAVASAVAASLEGLTAAERRLLLAAAVSVDGRVDVALTCAGLTMAEALSAGAAAHITFAAGRLAFTDPRVRVHLHATASLAERTSVHASLAAAYRSADDEGLAVWHTSLSTLEGDPTLVARLLELSSDARRAGAAEWAHAIAREASSHASGELRLHAAVAAGRAALDAGLVDDAVEWLQAPIAGPDAIAARALATFVHAVALRDGNVPDADVARHVARVLDEPRADAAEVAHVAKALEMAACRHAERGHDGDADELLELSDALNGAHDQPSWARAWCALFRTDADAGRVRGLTVADGHGGDRKSPYERIARALALADGDRCEHALGVLQGGAGATLGGSAPWSAELGQVRPAPLVEAHRRVAIALVQFWAGDLTRARSELAEAALVAPVALTFAGLAIALARRLDVCTDGVPLDTSLALEDTHPAPDTELLRGGILVDRAISAYLEGRMTEAATLLSLAADGASRATASGLRLPGLDESSVWAVTGRIGEARLAASRLEGSVAGMSALQRRAALARSCVTFASTPGAIQEATRTAAEVCRVLSSPYERARTEMVVGRGRAAHGDLSAARAHLLAASGLFDAAGAAVWRAACDADLELLPAEPPVSVLTGPTPVASAGIPGASRPPSLAREHDLDDEVESACRDAWSDVLTEREQDVALLVAQGHSNREVAAQLFVSVRTVEVHLGRIFAKLGVPSRVALTVQAHRIAREHQPVAG